MEQKRLNKFISDSGFCSRREADKLIEQGRVTVNGKFPEAGTKISAKDKVRIDDELLQMREEETVFLLFNKPAGIATTTDLSVKNNIIRALNYPASLLPIGFLDRDAEGLMFLSNDTELARKITKADINFEKEYLVTVDKHLTPEFLSKVSEGGIPEPGASRKKNFVAKEGTNRFRIVLEPGTNHHIKKVVEGLGYKVVHLQRTRLGDFTQAKLPVGMWRKLNAAEVSAITGIIKSKGRNRTDNFKNEAPDIFEKSASARTRPSKLTQPGSAKVAKSRTSNITPVTSKSARPAAKGTTVRRNSSTKSSMPSGRKPTSPSGGRRNTGFKK